MLGINAVPQRVWDLYRYVCQRLRPEATIIGHIAEAPVIEVLLAELEVARRILEETGSHALDPYCRESRLHSDRSLN